MDGTTSADATTSYEPPTVATVPLEEGTVFTAAGIKGSYEQPAPAPQPG